LELLIAQTGLSWRIALSGFGVAHDSFARADVMQLAPVRYRS
tara:strand:- start:30880 stop:31005 length:126 start_codon:yes stop_codon:yes gene_type:complete